MPIEMNQEQLLHRDLEILGGADNYLEMQYEKIERHLGKRILEVGAGTGNQLARIIGKNPDLILALERNPDFCGILRERFAQRVQVVCGDMEAVPESQARLLLSARLDTIIAVNFIEHIEDDLGCLTRLASFLEPKGRLVLITPASMLLYSGLDRRYGHFRRYSKKRMEGYCAALNMTLLENRYFNLSGWFGWLVCAKLGGCSCIDRRSMGIFDRLVGFLDRAESSITLPFGLSLLSVMEKA